MHQKVHELEARIHELEKASSPSLPEQLDSLLHCGNQVLHGPDTPANFSKVSIETIIEEIQTTAPGVYQLFLQLGNTQRNAADGERPAEERKAIMSLCTILNARSRKANGMQ